jgi:hypothetical protein
MDGWRLGMVASALLTLGMVMAPRASGQPLDVAPDRLSSVLLLAPRQRVTGEPPWTFGTTARIAHVIGASAFEPSSSTVSWQYTTPSPTGKFASQPMRAWVRLPAGAVVDSVEVEACDTAADRDVEFFLVRQASPAGPPLLVTPGGTTGVTETPGCGFFSVSPLPAVSPLVIDNENNTYSIEVDARTAETALTAVRVYYTLQVSPAPASATFTDVPTSHPFFQFVEALVASGITAGCGGGNYCPDAPLTRGQMAVFLSKALGLHFAP